MDMPTAFEQWDWQPFQVQVLGQSMGYRLMRPLDPDWRVLTRWFPECTEKRLSNFWLCEIDETTWTFFEFEQHHWVLMPLVKPEIRRTSPLPLGLDLLSVSESNGMAVYLYFSNKPLSVLKRQLRFRLAQRIETVKTLEQSDDLWLLKGNDGRLVFTQQGDWTFVTLLR